MVDLCWTCHDALQEEEYGRKQPVLLGDGPQMPVQQLPIMPPAIGYVYSVHSLWNQILDEDHMIHSVYNYQQIQI